MENVNIIKRKNSENIRAAPVLRRSASALYYRRSVPFVA